MPQHLLSAFERLLAVVPDESASALASTFISAGADRCQWNVRVATAIAGLATRAGASDLTAVLELARTSGRARDVLAAATSLISRSGSTLSLSEATAATALLHTIHVHTSKLAATVASCEYVAPVARAKEAAASISKSTTFAGAHFDTSEAGSRGVEKLTVSSCGQTISAGHVADDCASLICPFLDRASGLTSGVTTWDLTLSSDSSETNWAKFAENMCFGVGTRPLKSGSSLLQSSSLGIVRGNGQRYAFSKHDTGEYKEKVRALFSSTAPSKSVRISFTLDFKISEGELSIYVDDEYHDRTILFRNLRGLAKGRPVFPAVVFIGASSSYTFNAPKQRVVSFKSSDFTWALAAPQLPRATLAPASAADESSRDVGSPRERWLADILPDSATGLVSAQSSDLDEESIDVEPFAPLIMQPPLMSTVSFDADVDQRRDVSSLAERVRVVREGSSQIEKLAASAAYVLDEMVEDLRGCVSVLRESFDSDAVSSDALLFLVYGDGKLLWSSPPILAGDKLVPFRVNILGVRTLRLVVCASRSSPPPPPPLSTRVCRALPRALWHDVILTDAAEWECRGFRNHRRARRCAHCGEDRILRARPADSQIEPAEAALPSGTCAVACALIRALFDVSSASAANRALKGLVHSPLRTDETFAVDALSNDDPTAAAALLTIMSRPPAGQMSSLLHAAALLFNAFSLSTDFMCTFLDAPHWHAHSTLCCKTLSPFARLFLAAPTAALGDEADAVAINALREACEEFLAGCEPPSLSTVCKRSGLISSGGVLELSAPFPSSSPSVEAFILKLQLAARKCSLRFSLCGVAPARVFLVIDLPNGKVAGELIEALHTIASDTGFSVASISARVGRLERDRARRLPLETGAVTAHVYPLTPVDDVYEGVVKSAREFFSACDVRLIKTKIG